MCSSDLLDQEGDDLFNACVLVGPDGVLGSYRKIHLPYLGIDRFTTPGDRPFAVQAAGQLNIGMNICYDGAFPESSRIMARRAEEARGGAGGGVGPCGGRVGGPRLGPQ